MGAQTRTTPKKYKVKLDQLLEIGASQAGTSAGGYLDFVLAVSLVEKRLQTHLSTIELTEAIHEWKKKFGVLTAGADAHEVDVHDGFCFTCGVFHSGDGFDLVEKPVPLGTPVRRTRKKVNYYRDLAGVQHHEIRLDTKLWRLGGVIGSGDVDDL